MPQGTSKLKDAPPGEAEQDASWMAAESLRGQDFSVWRLERVKAEVEQASQTGGHALASAKTSPNVVMRFILRPVAFTLTSLTAFAFFIFYLMFSRYLAKPKDLPADATRLVAVHGEWSTRTKHILSALPNSDPPVSAILLLGRQYQRPEKIMALWCEHVPELKGLPVLAPVTFRAAFAALRDIPSLLREGLSEAISTRQLMNARGEVALAFRVYLGATQARWWRQHERGTTAEVLFGITGTADATLLEKAIQKTGGWTAHIVHGQATGPNFAGISDHALFKSEFDASDYDRLKCYRTCAVQTAVPPEPRRGEREILLLSNLAHPMNAGFRSNGITDELNLLECVSRAAGLLHLSNTTLSWKPHPVIHQLDPALVAQLRVTARLLGFVELPTDTSLADASKNARWVVCSPSTVATELLQMGTLSLILDPQCSAGSTAISALPLLATLQPEALAALMADIDRPEKYEAVLREVYAIIKPSRPLDLSAPLH